MRIVTSTAGSTLFAALALLVSGAGALAACSDPRPSTATAGEQSAGPSAPSTYNACSTPNEGCPCASEGEVVACGMVREVSPTGYVSCAEGTRVCESGGRWGACNGTHVVTTKMASTVHFSGLGAVARCSAANACDPYCMMASDDAPGLDAGAGFSATDAGLSLTPQTVGDTCTSMILTAASPTITVTAIDGTTGAVTNSPVQTPVTATLAPAGCAGASPSITWSIDNLDRATIDASGVVRNVAGVGGPLVITGYFGSLTASTILNVKVAIADAPAPATRPVPAGQGAKYSDPIGAPSDVTWEYPYDQTVFPLGLAAPLVQYIAGANPGNSVKLTLRYPAATGAKFDWSMKIGELIKTTQEVPIPQAVWRAFEQTAKGDTARITLQRWAASNLQTPTTRDIVFATDNLAGRIFYTEYERKGVAAPSPNPGGACGSFASNAARTRALDPGTSTAVPIDAVGGGGCPVCHTVSANGRTLVTADRAWGANAGVLRIDTGGTTTPIANSPQYPGTSAGEPYRGFAWAALAPNGDYALQGSFLWGNVRWDGATTAAAGAKPYVIWKVSTTPGVAPVLEPSNWGLGNTFMLVPTFAPNGKKLAFIDGDATAGGGGWRRGLSIFDADIAAKSFTNRRNVVSTGAGGAILKWPTFESDSESIVYVRSVATDRCTPGACDGKTGNHGYGNMAPSNYNTGTGELWSVEAKAGATPVELQRANDGERPDDENKAYQPTVLPQSQGGYRWVIFTSTRPFGHLVNPVGTNATCAAGQLWVAAVDDTKSGAVDRSHPAFWLPQQNYSTNITTKNFTNERAYWVLDQCRAPGTSAASLCSSDDDCCAGSKCRIDLPVSSPPVRHCQTVTSCSLAGNSCATTADCCSPAICAQAQCAYPQKFDPATFTRDYQGKCAVGEQLQWRYFEWKSATPVGTSISFKVQTASTLAGLASAPLISVATAQAPPTQTTGWASSTQTVDEILAASGFKSLEYLRVTMAFTPSASPSNTPVLQAWRQLFDCTPAE